MKTTAQKYVEAIERGNVAQRIRYERELEAEQAAEEARMNAPDYFLKTALWYARRGVAVFPCEYRGKKPFVETLPNGEKFGAPNGFHDATTDEAQIIKWWTVRPGANIGAPTGHLFDVIDIDGGEAVAAVYFGDAPFIDSIDKLGVIGKALTSREAGHHIYVRPTGRGNGTNIVPGVSIDYRGKGGYVIVPPSIGAEKRYIWTQPLQIASAA